MSVQVYLISTVIIKKKSKSFVKMQSIDSVLKQMSNDLQEIRYTLWCHQNRQISQYVHVLAFKYTEAGSVYVEPGSCAEKPEQLQPPCGKRQQVQNHYFKMGVFCLNFAKNWIEDILLTTS